MKKAVMSTEIPTTQPKRHYTSPVLHVQLLEEADVVTASWTNLKNYTLTASGKKQTAFDWSVWNSTDAE